MQVSVRELKNKLSYYLNLVQQGEQLMVTSHRKTVATMQRLENVSADNASTDIRWSQQKPNFDDKVIPLDANTLTLAEIVIESRA